ncbi:MAG: CPBP family intramembrane metalloprotease [Lachnospiraceae bacterium]|nr:CPBP family intramembrane metalloprotease [Lachnospiraceae bacterium]
MEERRKPGGFLRCLGPFFAAVALQNGIAFFITEIMLVHKISTSTGNYSDIVMEAMKELTTSDFNAMVSIVYSVLAVIIMGLWYAKDKANNQNVNLSFKGYSPTIVFGIIFMGIGGQIFCNYIVQMIGKLYPSLLAEYLKLLEDAGLSENVGLMMIIYAVIFGPVSEELIFRGLIYGKLRRSYRFWTANILQALLFALFHMNPMQGIYVFLMGIVFGYLMEKTGNIYVTIMLHICYNALALFMGWMLEAIPQNPFVTFGFILASLFLVYIGIMIVLNATSGNDKGAVKEN